MHQLVVAAMNCIGYVLTIDHDSIESVSGNPASINEPGTRCVSRSHELL
jgi:hypothetical protein